MKTVMLLTPVPYNKETEVSNQFARTATRNSLMENEAPLVPALLWNGREKMNLAIATWATVVSEIKFFLDPNDATAIHLANGADYNNYKKLDRRVIIEAEERQWGIDAGLTLGMLAQATIVFHDLGISRGMEYGIAAANKANRPVEYVKLDS